MSNSIKHIPYVLKANQSISMYLNGESIVVETDHPNYNKVVDALKNGDFDKINSLVNISKSIEKYSKKMVRVRDGQIFFGTYHLHNTLTERILAMMNQGFKFEHMLNFLENLMENPSARAVNETYTFLENHGLPITDDGCFLAYKAVRNDYMDKYTRTFDNHVGKSPEMPRNQVNENYEEDCSDGLHCGALAYVIDYGHFTKGQPVNPDGDRLMIVKVNPRDVVSVPKYDSHTKMRVSTYTVVDEIKDIVKELDKVVYTSEASPLEPDEELNSDFDDTDFDADAFDTEECDCKECKNSDELTYAAGYSDGECAAANDMKYGHGRRDLTPKSPYSNGYNDAYNDRPFACPEEWEDEDYSEGYDAGENDFNVGFDYKVDSNRSAAFNNGYRDGYNGYDC